MPQAIREDDSDQPSGRDGQHILVVRNTLAGRSILNPDKTNVRIEFDFRGGRDSRLGAAWAVADTNGDRLVDDAYLFYFSDIPRTIRTPAQKANWHLVKREAGVDTVVATRRRRRHHRSDLEAVLHRCQKRLLQAAGGFPLRLYPGAGEAIPVHLVVELHGR